jgi:hypothetical protein
MPLQKLDIFSENSPLLENEKDTLSSALSDPLDPTKLSEDNLDINSSVTEQVWVILNSSGDVLLICFFTFIHFFLYSQLL